MFGVDESQPTTDLLKILISLHRHFGTFTVWYEYVNAVNSDIHRSIMSFLSSYGKKVGNVVFHFFFTFIFYPDCGNGLIGIVFSMWNPLKINFMR